MVVTYTFGGTFYVYSFQDIEIVIFFVIDLVFRSYSLLCLNMLYQKFKSEFAEKELISMKENKLQGSYGTVDELKSTPSHHHVTFTFNSLGNSLNMVEMKGRESKDELRSIHSVP
jgi:hypothetical protein